MCVCSSQIPYKFFCSIFISKYEVINVKYVIDYIALEKRIWCLKVCVCVGGVLLLGFFLGSGMSCSLGCPGTHYKTKAGLPLCSSFYLPNAGITDIHHHSNENLLKLQWFFFFKGLSSGHGDVCDVCHHLNPRWWPWPCRSQKPWGSAWPMLPLTIEGRMLLLQWYQWPHAHTSVASSLPYCHP